jgi:peptidoglycan/LPS O-acetylase OafA/YrhL
MAMKIGNWLKAEVEYGRNLAGSGWQGARDAAGSMLHGEAVGELLGRSVRASWAPTALGAGLGAACALIAGGRKPKAAAVAAMGVVGGVVGFTAGVAWETRQLSGEIARGAMRRIGTTRDSHWLGKHPISFG